MCTEKIVCSIFHLCCAREREHARAGSRFVPDRVQGKDSVPTPDAAILHQSMVFLVVQLLRLNLSFSVKFYPCRSIRLYGHGISWFATKWFFMKLLHSGRRRCHAGQGKLILRLSFPARTVIRATPHRHPCRCWGRSFASSEYALARPPVNYRG